MSLIYLQKNCEEKTWHVGDPLPRFPMFHWESPVLFVRASGPELDWILLRFKNIPHVPSSVKKVQTWKGDLAQFIMDNLVD